MFDLGTSLLNFTLHRRTENFLNFKNLSQINRLDDVVNIVFVAKNLDDGIPISDFSGLPTFSHGNFLEKSRFIALFATFLFRFHPWWLFYCIYFTPIALVLILLALFLVYIQFEYLRPKYIVNNVEINALDFSKDWGLFILKFNT